MRRDHAHAIIGFVAGALFASLATQALAQDRLSSWAKPTVAAESGAGWIVFSPGSSITVEVMIGNDADSKTYLTLDSGFFRQVSLSLVDLDTGQPVATLKEWQVTGYCAGVPACPIDSPMHLAPGEIGQFQAQLATDDSTPVSEGQYGLRIVLEAARQRILANDGSVWRGAVTNEHTAPLIVREVKTASDARLADQQELIAAMLAANHERVFAIYQRIIAREPDAPGAHAGAGSALLALGRFAEAAGAFERSMARGAPRESTVPTQLAIAYFALNDEARAQAVLRSSFAVGMLPQLEKTMREAAARLRSRAR